MDQIKTDFLEVLPLSDHALFEQRENEKFHTSYRTEVMFFSCIARGDRASLEKAMQPLFLQKVTTGRLSKDPLRQMQYWAVCCITLATRYAIQGGLDELYAYNFSDACVLAIDSMTSGDEIMDFLVKKSFALADLVAARKRPLQYPYAIRTCMHVIEMNLNRNLKIAELAEACGWSADYLSAQFHKVTGIKLSDYIKKQKLSAAVELLEHGYTCSETAFNLGFSSESYFIKCFKAQWGVTPGKYRLSGTE